MTPTTEFSGDQARILGQIQDRNIIKAVAGSGKTHVLAELIRRSAEAGHLPVVVSFTRRAAAEIAARAFPNPAQRDRSGVFTGTIHSLAFFSRPDPLPVVSEENARKIMSQIGVKASDIARDIHAAILSGHRSRAVRRLMDAVHERGVDTWDTMLATSFYAVQDHAELFVDEAQDLSPTDAAFLIRAGFTRVTLVGDPAQQIFRWRGGAWENALAVAHSTPHGPVAAKHHTLATNFRCPRAVGTWIRMELASRGSDSQLLTVFPSDRDGSVDGPITSETPFEAAARVRDEVAKKGETIMLLHETNAEVVASVKAGAARTKSPTVDAYLTARRLMLEALYIGDEDMLREAEEAAATLGFTDRASLDITSTDREDLAAWLRNMCLQDPQEPEICPNVVHVSTIHGVKGLEFDHVIAPFRFRGKESIEKAYVAWTRAKQTLTLID